VVSIFQTYNENLLIAKDVFWRNGSPNADRSVIIPVSGVSLVPNRAFAGNNDDDIDLVIRNLNQ
jgi:hypothetical protein